MIFVAADLVRSIEGAAETAYPDECCGLLVGWGDDPRHDGNVVVTRVEPSANVAEGGTADRFEVDPRLRLRLMRELGNGPLRIVGHYHSHPDHLARPSRRDSDMAWEPDLVWVITSVKKGRAIATTAHIADPRSGGFRELTLHVGLPPGCAAGPAAGRRHR